MEEVYALQIIKHLQMLNQVKSSKENAQLSSILMGNNLIEDMSFILFLYSKFYFFKISFYSWLFALPRLQ